MLGDRFRSRSRRVHDEQPQWQRHLVCGQADSIGGVHQIKHRPDHLLEVRVDAHQTSSRGSTALYDAVVASNVHLRNNPRLDKKVLLVITDGQDNMSRETLQDAMRKLQTNKGATLYAIGLSDDGMTGSAREALQNLAASTVDGLFSAKPG